MLVYKLYHIIEGKTIDGKYFLLIFIMKERQVQLMRVGFFACPSVSRVSPATISPSFECVEILTGGKLYFEVNGERRLFERGAVFWHSEGEHTICETDANDPYRCFVLYFRVGDNRRPGPRASVWDPPESAVDFATECHKAFHAGGADMEALSDYAYSTIRWKGSPHPASMEVAFPEPLKRAITYIQRTCTSAINPEIVAEKANLSRPYLFALFREYMKMTPHHYILSQRIGKAKLLLSGGLTPIKEIATLCGFESLEVFYRSFKKETTLTPADYRKRYSPYPESWEKVCFLRNRAGKADAS